MKKAGEGGRERDTDRLVYTRESMDTGSYLVHVYRNAADPRAPLAGTVERLGNGERQAFHSVSELLQLMNVGKEVMGENNDE